MESPYKEWFKKNYSDYSVDSSSSNELSKLLHDKSIVVFMGTWCGDSKREVPRLLKILDYCAFPDSSLKLIMVDYRDGAYKQSPQHEEKGLNIFRVPTILIFQGTNEVGRIIESPKESLEKDLILILRKATYSPNYPGGYGLLQKVMKEKVSKLNTDSASIIRSLQTTIKNGFELGSIGHILLDQGLKKKSLFVYRLNKDLFPTAANSWNGLARAYSALNKKEDASNALQKALSLDSDNEETKRLIKELRF
jgi:tetratricopeptide (TPR) repeat protein